MFAKLKKKIEEEVQTDLSKSYSTTSATPSPSCSRKTGNSRSSSPSRLNSSDRERRTSVSSTDSKDSYRHGAETSEELTSLLRTKTEQVKRLETRLQEYYCALQTQLDNKNKLEDDLAKEKVAGETALRKKDEEYKQKMELLETDKVGLSKKLESAKLLHNSFIEKQENIEELEGFQTQEMAKIKHLLLNCQQELQSKQEEINRALSELEVEKSNVTRLTTENNRFEEKLDKEEAERVRLTELEINNAILIKELTESRDLLRDQLNVLKKDAEENNSKNNQNKQKLAELLDEKDALRHSHEVYYESTSKVLDEKNALISHLEERITILEQRVSDSSLNEDEKYQAIIVERDNLEKKLEESRQQLVEIKSTWSEKIVNLEKQISHLNKKMAEDSQEMQRLEDAEKMAKKCASEEITNLKEELTQSKLKCDDLGKELESGKQTWTNEKLELENEIMILRSSKQTNEKEASELIKSLKEEIRVLKGEKEIEINKFEAKKVECDELLQTHARKVEDLTQTNKQLQETANCKQQELDQVSVVLEEEKSKTRELENKVKEVEVENHKIEEIYESLKTEKTNVESELEEISKKLKEETQSREETENALKKCNDDGELLNGKINDQVSLLESTQSEVDRLTRLIAEAEEAAKGNNAKSEEVTELNLLVGSLENELTDRNKTIKLQQQRINDMKKTLQRELKMQVGGASDVSNGDGSLAEANKNFGSTSSLSQKDAMTADFLQKLQNHEPGDLPIGEDVNFRYLKHVILKFMTSREYEAQHLIKAVSVLLHFTADEERLIRDTLDWKMSWFGSKPKFGSGQLSKTIPTKS